MHKIIPIFYSEYGRYISRFRAIPLYIDALKPVERRILLGLYETARTKPVKSAKVIGYVMGSYHPHGDQSIYSTMVDMVKRGLAIGEGNWSSEGIKEDPPAAMRYTEIQSQKWINSLAFEYCKPEFIPWQELELESEPLFLPSPIPIGLIGTGVITGISFYTTTIPRYDYKDLKNRLVWLLENVKDKIDTSDIDGIKCDVKQFGPLIKPNISNCITTEAESNAYYKILLNGYGQLRIIPNGEIDQKKKEIYITGKPPVRNNFGILIRRCDGIDFKGKPLKEGKINANIKDLSKSTLKIAVYPEKKSQNLTDLATEIWEIISPTINFNCQFCDNEGKLFVMGIDTILRASYDEWTKAVLNKKIYDTYKLYDKFFEAHIIHYIRQLDLKGITTVDDVVNAFTKSGNIPPVICEEFNKNKWTSVSRIITDKEVREVCSRRSIKQLIEAAIDFNKIQNDIKNNKKLIINNDLDCLNQLKAL